MPRAPDVRALRRLLRALPVPSRDVEGRASRDSSQGGDDTAHTPVPCQAFIAYL